MLCENADPVVRQGMETFMAKLVPDGDAIFLDQDEGLDDMAVRVRTIGHGAPAKNDCYDSGGSNFRFFRRYTCQAGIKMIMLLIIIYLI